jgi:vancomycin resistance protein YoaR
LIVIGTALVVCGVAVGFSARSLVRWFLPQGDTVARGVTLDGHLVAENTSAAPLVHERSQRLRERKVSLYHDGRELTSATLADLGVRVDEARATAALLSVGRSGSLLSRCDDAWQARQGTRAVVLGIELPVEVLAARLEAFKVGYDRKAVPARWNFDKDQATQHEDALYVDVYAAAEAIDEAVRSSPEGEALRVELPILRTAPSATREVVATVDRSQVVSVYETRFADSGGQAGRGQNILRAAGGIDGVVIMPGEVISFNELVGPRSEDNGFALAGEIYKGEMRLGIGGGTCQVASTLHAAAYFGGLDVVQRSPHSRPSGYIGIGLDATVAYPTVDLKLKNPYPFAVVVRALANKGTLTLEIHGADKPLKSEYTVATVGVRAYKRTVREAHWLPEGKVILKQRGIRGVSVEKVRTIRYADGSEKKETSLDVYPPTNEVYIIGPGVDRAEALPPLPSDVVATG